MVTRAGVGAMDMLAHARSCLQEAAVAVRPTDRYAMAHLAALRTAAAVLAARTHGAPPGRRQSRNAWVLLAQVAPELEEWAAFFAAGATKRAAAQAGISSAVSTREADDLLREAETFLAVSTRMLGLPHHPELPGLTAPLRAG
ncbi:MAG: SAV_6107 family HEPN domain-containing protein [Jiangellales bacterium]